MEDDPDPTTSTNLPLEAREDMSENVNPIRRINTTASSAKAGSEWGGSERADTCRICRSEGTSEEPLFFPCKCSGSIKYVHQECLMEWLSHSHKKHCELCKTSFRFTKLYDAKMPDVLPWGVFLQRALVHVTKTIAYACRILLVAMVWLVALPGVVRWAWRWLFWMADAGWAREFWIHLYEQQITDSHAVIPSLLRSNQNASTTSGSSALVAAASKFVTGLKFNNAVVAPPALDPASLRAASIILPPSNHSILSSWTYISQMTSNSHLNRAILDIFEGQLITSVVITGFILVFLIREWVVQQHPIPNQENFENVQQNLRDAVDMVQANQERVRRQHELIDEARRRLRDLQLGTIVAEAISRKVSDTADDFVGWSRLETAIDELMVDRRNPTADGTYDPSRSIEWVFDQISSANAVEGDFEDIVAKFKAKLANFTDEELLLWGSVARSELRRRTVSTNEHLSALLVPTDLPEAPLTATGSSQSTASVDISVDNDAEASEYARQDFGQERDQDSESRSNAEGHIDEVRHLLQEATSATEAADAAFTASETTAAQIELLEHLNLASEGYGNPAAEMPITNAGPDAKINVFCSVRAAGKIVPQPLPVISTPSNVVDVPPQSDSTSDRPGRDAAPESADIVIAEVSTQGQSSASEAPPPLEQQNATLGAGTEDGVLELTPSTEIPIHEEASDLDNSTSNAPTLHEPAAEAGFTALLTNWLWGDITVTHEVEPAPAPRQERVRDDMVEDAPEAANDRHRPENPIVQHGPLEEARDAEVVAAAAAAGVDPEAIDDVEDIEGILELIGLQGPLLGLIQTSAFCTVLVIGTVGAAIGLPYLWGKLVLSFVANPIYFSIQAPLRLASFIADTLVDIALLSSGWIILILSYSTKVTLSHWFPLLSGSELLQSVLSFANNITHTSGQRLQVFLVPVEDIANLPLLSASGHAHASLNNIKHEINSTSAFVISCIGTIVDAISAPANIWSKIFSYFPVLKSLVLRSTTAVTEAVSYVKSFSHILATLSTGAITFDTPEITLDPSLVFWSTTDRFLTVTIGYLALAALAVVYVAADTTITSSSTGQKTEKIIRDSLRQAGGVLKVILIISIEMLAFPFYCGLLLDLAFLPLFGDSSVATRWVFAINHPHMFCFIHWFVGTCYMFHFALFVGMCRKILRKGVLWFIRDPDDPTFHPVRDVLERSVTTQLRKIAFSALVYGALVILCLGGVIWSLDHTFGAIFPVHLTSTESIMEFPMDLVLYNAITPVIVRILKPSDAVHLMYAWWLRHCARGLRLSHFLFDDRRIAEEGRHVRRTWSSFFLMKKGEIVREGDNANDQSLTEPDRSDVNFVRDGKYVLTPCCDQYRPPKRGEAILHADETDVFIVNRDGKRNEHFTKVYIPPLFRLRVSLFMVCLWIFSVFLGLCVSLLPLLLGRRVLITAIPEARRINDIYAYSIGIYLLGACGSVLLGVKMAFDRVSSMEGFSLTASRLATWVRPAAQLLSRMMKCIYTYGFLGVIFPLLTATVIQFYVVLPLHTYLASLPQPQSITLTPILTNSTLSSPVMGALPPANISSTSFAAKVPPTVAVTGHTVHLLQDYCLGVLFVRVLLRGIYDERPGSRVLAGFRRIMAKGLWNPDIRLVTRYVVIPALALAMIALLTPPLLTKSFLVLIETYKPQWLATNLSWRVQLYRYSYPMMASLVLLIMAGRGLSRATQRWRSQIRDEVYLVEERLHNFGEARPPSGSKSISRKER